MRVTLKLWAEPFFASGLKENTMKLPLITASIIMYALLAVAWLCYAAMRHGEQASLF